MNRSSSGFCLAAHCFCCWWSEAFVRLSNDIQQFGQRYETMCLRARCCLTNPRTLVVACRNSQYSDDRSIPETHKPVRAPHWVATAPPQT
jgi:hypothetical protein